MDVIAAIHGRRSVRSYDRRPAPRDLIESVILDAAQTPPPFRGQVPRALCSDMRVFPSLVSLRSPGLRSQKEADRARDRQRHRGDDQPL
jgi:hypothetical protein